MSFCNLTIQEFKATGLNAVTGTCPAKACGLPVALDHNDDTPPPFYPFVI